MTLNPKLQTGGTTFTFESAAPKTEWTATRQWIINAARWACDSEVAANHDCYGAYLKTAAAAYQSDGWPSGTRSGTDS